MTIHHNSPQSPALHTCRKLEPDPLWVSALLLLLEFNGAVVEWDTNETDHLAQSVQVGEAGCSRQVQVGGAGCSRQMQVGGSGCSRQVVQAGNIRL